MSARKNDLEQKLMSAKTKLEHENISVQVSTRAGFSCQVEKNTGPVTGLGNRGPLKDFNDSKLILNEFK